MNRKVYGILALTLVFLAFGLLTGCSSSSSSAPPPPPVIEIAATSGGGQMQTITEAFPSSLLATVTSNGTPASGISVTFSAPSSNASCTLSATSVTTNSSGQATVNCTANSTPGAYAVSATATGATTPASFSLTNAPPTVFTFAMSGLEAPNSVNEEECETNKENCIVD